MLRINQVAELKRWVLSLGADGEVVEVGNSVVRAIATPGHAPAHHAYVIADRRRGDEEPWLVFSGDSLLIGDVGRPDLHVSGDAHGQARLLHASLRRLLELPDHVVLLPSHYGGSVCGRGLSGNPFSSLDSSTTSCSCGSLRESRIAPSSVISGPVSTPNGIE